MSRLFRRRLNRTELYRNRCKHLAFKHSKELTEAVMVQGSKEVRKRRFRELALFVAIILFTAMITLSAMAIFVVYITWP